jgi:ribosomal protein S6--L-glutamate ligase
LYLSFCKLVFFQEFIKESNGKDIRAFVIGDRVVASMMRTAKDGEFRSNLHRGGTAGPVDISDEEAAMAVNAAKALGLNVAGVDLLRSSRGPLVLEVNSSPGLQGIETSTGLDIASMIIEYIEKNITRLNYAG